NQTPANPRRRGHEIGSGRHDVQYLIARVVPHPPNVVSGFSRAYWSFASDWSQRSENESMVRASRVRGGVLTFAFLLAVITYLDRICISAAAPFIMQDLHLSVLQMSVVFSAFTLAYSLFEIPSGWLGDVKGPRRVLTRIVLWWSAFTMLTGAAAGFRSLVTIRFCFGAGEAGAFPNIARSFSQWFPRVERGRANGVMFLGSRMGGMLSAPIALLLVTRIGWRATFFFFGLFGLVWAIWWFAWYRDRPEDHKGVNTG